MYWLLAIVAWFLVDSGNWRECMLVYYNNFVNFKLIATNKLVKEDMSQICLWTFLGEEQTETYCFIYNYSIFESTGN